MAVTQNIDTLSPIGNFSLRGVLTFVSSDLYIQYLTKVLNPIEHLWGILKWKVEERKVSNIHQLRDFVMEEWKRTPVATCEALVNSMPMRVKAVLENNGSHTKY